jgi:hypothetical protein
MIRIIEGSQTITKVAPSNNLFIQLGLNTHDYKDLLSELIDNSIAAKIPEQTLKVIIDLYVRDNTKAERLIIKDDAAGIPQEKLGDAISPGALQSADSLNEHGLGMKQAIAGLGKLEYLATKIKGEEKARVITNFGWGDLPTHLAEFDLECGTEISIINLNSRVLIHPQHINQFLIPILGARYRRFLRQDNKILNLKFNLRDINDPESVKANWIITEEKPIYFNPLKRTNEPSIYCHKLKGKSWEAELTFGYAPMEDKEYEELGLDIPRKFDPYFVSIGKQGLDILYQNRVILFHQLSEIGLVVTRHNIYNDIRGEIDLKKGFSTAITKNSIIHDENFQECIELIHKILTGEIPGPDGIKDYISNKRFPADIPEILLRDRLAKWLISNTFSPKKNVKKEYVIEGIEGFIDILADGEAWELKVNQVCAYDVYQLFMYMDVGHIERGYLVGQSFTVGASVATEFIKENHKKEIVLAPREDFPINHQPNEAERKEYLG